MGNLRSAPVYRASLEQGPRTRCHPALTVGHAPSSDVGTARPVNVTMRDGRVLDDMAIPIAQANDEQNTLRGIGRLDSGG